METLGNKILQNSAQKFYCNMCDYTTCRGSSYKEHFLSAKHQNNANGNILETNGNAKFCSVKFACEKCDKKFTSRSGLWKHKKKCDIYENIEKEDDTECKTLTNLVLEVVKQNKELINQNNELANKIVEMSKNGICNTNITNNNSNNKTFNLNVFLNETCKDAMNIMDFVDSLTLQLSDLESVGKLGYVEGISNIIIKNLKEMDVHKRPVHCADKKREIMYIKDEDKWEKEDEEKNKIRKAIKRVVAKNQRLLPEFKKEHPDCGNYHSKFSDQYNKIIVESMGGSGDNDLEKEDKIIKKIASEVVINKNF